MRIAILGQSPSLTLNLVEAFSIIGQVKLFTIYPSDFREYPIDTLLDNANSCDEARRYINKSDIIFIAGAISLECLPKIFGNNWLKLASKLLGQVIVFGTDSPYWRNPAYFNGIISEIGALLFLMPNLISIANRPSIPLFLPQPVLDSNDKNERITVVHSPGRAVKMEIKGTPVIEETIRTLWGEGLKFEYRRITGATYRESLLSKQKAHIVIDQLPPPGMVRGLGSSGLEGLAAGCVVLTDTLDTGRTKDYFAYPPVVPVHSKEELKSELTRAVLDTGRYQELSIAGQQWIKDNLDFKPWLAYLQRYL